MIAPSSYGKKYKDSFDIIYPDLAKKFNLLFIFASRRGFKSRIKFK